MQKTSALYEELLASDHWTETRLVIGETGVLITKQGDRITFGSRSYTAEAKGSVIRLENVPEAPLRGLTIYGKTTQDGTPSPDNPVPLISPGDSGVLNVYVGDQTLPISTTNGLPGIPVTSGGNYTDENGQQWICDEVDFDNGVYVQRVGKKVYENSSKVEYNTRSGNTASVVTNDVTTDAIEMNVICTHFVTKTVNNACYYGGIACRTGGTGFAMGINLGYAADTHTQDEVVQMFKTLIEEQYAAGTPVTVYYVMKEPIRTPLTVEELAAYAAMHTNYPNTTIYNDGGADMVVGYALNGEGATGILTGISGADGGYDETVLISMETDSRVFSEDFPIVGSCVSAEIDVEMLKPYGDIPKRARLVPYVRLTDGQRYSEWIQKGVFYIDTRTHKEDGSGIEKIVIHGYDDMLKAEQDYPESTMSWPAKDIDVVREIADFIGVSLDERTEKTMDMGYPIQYPAGYSCRDTLGYIAAMYAGCFILSDVGELRLVAINDIPAETRYLIEKSGFVITFGGDRILV